MEGAGILIPILVPLAFFLTIFGIVYLHKRERMALIERGMDPRRYKSQSAPYQNLKWGLLLIGTGVGLFLAYVVDSAHVFSHVGDDNPAVYFSLIAIFGGLGLFQSYRMELKANVDKKDIFIEE